MTAKDPITDARAAGGRSGDVPSEAERQARATLATPGLWIVKVGSSLITDDGRGLDHALIEAWACQIAALREQGHRVVVVSSGAVAQGLVEIGSVVRPTVLSELQAAAAIGQPGLVAAWDAALRRHDAAAALVLLTHEDLADRTRYLNARSTLRTILGHGVVPVINENDTVVNDEICFGDNDTLAALVANLLEADVLVILTDQLGLHRGDPRRDPSVPLVSHAAAEDPGLDGLAGGGGVLGRGGMITKVRAARIAARSGACTLIASGREPQALQRLASGERMGTLLVAEAAPLDARKRWIAGQLQTRGTLTLDRGAVRAVEAAGSSLLPVGVLAIEGLFQRGDAVLCIAEDGREVAIGLVNYGAETAARILGCDSEEIEQRLGLVQELELIHRDNLVLVQSGVIV